MKRTGRRESPPTPGPAAGGDRATAAAASAPVFRKPPGFRQLQCAWPMAATRRQNSKAHGWVATAAVAKAPRRGAGGAESRARFATRAFFALIFRVVSSFGWRRKFRDMAGRDIPFPGERSHTSCSGWGASHRACVCVCGWEVVVYTKFFFLKTELLPPASPHGPRPQPAGILCPPRRHHMPKSVHQPNELST